MYFSIFSYPLKLEEIYSYTNHERMSETEKELQHLIAEKIITKVDEFYIYGTDLESVTKRLRGNFGAAKIMQKAIERAKFISKFPYVEAVGVSGSLSKNYYDKDGDIDFFVITKPNKLWICRTLLMLYKKIFLLNSKKYFCINYFISTANLEIEEKNRFTATELKTLIPMQGKVVFQEFYHKNKWVNDYFSKFDPDLSQVQDSKKIMLSKTIELLLNNNIGGFIDNGFKKITLETWKSKFHFMKEEDFKIALKSTKNISKHHPAYFQKKVILALNGKIEEVKNNFNIILQKEHA